MTKENSNKGKDQFLPMNSKGHFKVLFFYVKQTTWEIKQHTFSNGMGVHALHYCEYRTHIQQGININLQYLPEHKKCPRYEETLFLHVCISS